MFGCSWQLRGGDGSSHFVLLDRANPQASREVSMDGKMSRSVQIDDSGPYSAYPWFEPRQREEIAAATAGLFCKCGST
jgi:hypothetical protein